MRETADLKAYELTQHASDALTRRQIPLSWMEQVVVAPALIEDDAVDDALEHRLGPIAEFEDRVLRVILKKNSRPLKIITVYFDRGATRP